MTASAATSVALLTHSAHPKEGNCSMFSVRGSCKCLSAGLYRFLLRPFLLHLLLFLSRQHLLRGVSLFVCLSIVWIALTCEALGQYLCTTLCQCAKCRRRSLRWRSRWSCRCRRVLSPARSLSPELCLVRWVALNIALLMSKSWMEEQLRLCPDCLVARKVSWSDHSTPSWWNVNNVKFFDDVLWSHDGIFRQSKCVENIPKNRRFFNDMQLAGKWKAIAEDSTDW